YIILPCYNEEEVLPFTKKEIIPFYRDLIEKKLIAEESKLVFVDDGSKDLTWELINEYSNEEATIEGIKLAQNAGHQNALLAGLTIVNDKADCTISIDADLQDDI